MKKSNSKTYYIDSTDVVFKKRVEIFLKSIDLKQVKRFSEAVNLFVVDFETSKYLDKIKSEKILFICADISHKNFLSKYPLSKVFYKPVSDYEISTALNTLDTFFSNTSDILSAVYITSKQLEKINNDFKTRINELSDYIGNNFIIDSHDFLDELIKIIIDYLSDFLQARKVSILFADKDRKKDLLYNIEISDKKIFKKLYLVNRGMITEKILKTGESVIVKDISKTPFNNYINNLKIYNTSSFMAVPVKYSGKTVALIYVTDKKKGVFSKKELNIVETISKSLERFFAEKLHKFNELLNIGINREKIEYEKEKLLKDLSKTIVLLKNTQEELKIKSNELNVLYSINSFVRNTLVVDELLKMIVDTIIYSMKVQRASVILIGDDEDGEDIIVSGIIGKSKKRVDNFKVKDRGVVSEYIVKHGKAVKIMPGEFNQKFKGKYHDNYQTESFISVPVKIKNRVIAIINVTDKQEGRTFNDDDLKVLEILANQTAITVENFRLSSQLIEREKISHELNIARDIQMKLMPTAKIDTKDYLIDFMCIPAKEVGGDYVDFIDIDEFNKAVVIGDVSGKGVPAAMLMVMLRTLIRSFAIRELSPATLVEKVNNLLVEDIDPKVFATLFYGVYNIRKKTLRFCNAGHNYPILVRNGKIISELNTGDVVMGFFENYAFHEDTIKLEKNDILYLFTDGVVEAQSSNGKIYGNQKFNALLEEVKPETVFDKLLDDIKVFVGKEHFSDDLTISYLRIK
ncbi:MAG: SpoIIE family protein phosphatase [Candidatus Muiribacteriota bacterium]